VARKIGTTARACGKRDRYHRMSVWQERPVRPRERVAREMGTAARAPQDWPGPQLLAKIFQYLEDSGQ